MMSVIAAVLGLIAAALGIWKMYIAKWIKVQNLLKRYQSCRQSREDLWRRYNEDVNKGRNIDNVIAEFNKLSRTQNDICQRLAALGYDTSGLKIKD